MIRRSGLAVLALFALSGCATRLVDFTVISTKNQIATEGFAKGSRVTGSDCVFVFLIPLGAPNLKSAIDKAIEGAGPGYDALVDGVVYTKNYSFLLGQLCYEVQGTPINTRSRAAAEIAPDRIMTGTATPAATALTRSPGAPCNADWKELAEARQGKLKACLLGGAGCEAETASYAEARSKAGNCWPSK